MEFVFIATAHFLALLSPGPDFFLILRSALVLPRGRCLAICLGITLGNATYITGAVLGLELLRGSPWLTSALRILGALYLIYLGSLLLRAPKQQLTSQINKPPPGRNKGWPVHLTIGFLSAILNPKNGIFYLSLFTVMVAPATALYQRALYGCWMAGIVLAWDSLLALCIYRLQCHDRFGSLIYPLEKLSGVMLLLFGLLLPFG